MYYNFQIGWLTKMDIRTVDYSQTTYQEYFLDFATQNPFISEGACFYVYKLGDSVLKVQREDYNSDTNKEAYLWLEFCLRNRDSKYIPNIVDYYKLQFKDIAILCVEVEALRSVNSILADDIRTIFGSFITQEYINFSDEFNLSILKRTKESKVFKELVEPDFFEFMDKLVLNTKEIARKYGDTSFSCDLHFNNFMVRPSTNNIVVIDHFTCSLYEVE